MVAAVRAGAYNKAKPRGRAPAKSQARKSVSAAATPKFRARASGAGVPPKVALMAATGAVVIAAAIALFTGDRLGKLGGAIEGGIASQLAGVGFKLSSLKITGASPMASRAIADAAGLGKDDPILGVDLEALRLRVKAVGWVEEASVVRLLPDTILVNVVERPPAAVWQTGGVMRVIDHMGRTIPEASPASFPDLPLLVGGGANEAGVAVLDLVRQRPRLAERLEALVRVDGRRWDLRLKDGTIIQLPAVGEDSALIQLDTLDRTERVLDLGLERIDLRSPDMVVVRRRDTPVSAGLVAGGY